MKLDPSLPPHTNVKSKCMKDLNLRPHTVKPLQTLQDMSSGKDFLSNIPQAHTTKAENGQMGSHQVKSEGEETVNRVKRQPTEGENMFENHPSDKRLITRIYKEFKQRFRKKKKLGRAQ